MSKAKLLGLVIDRREVGDEPPKLKAGAIDAINSGSGLMEYLPAER